MNENVWISIKISLKFVPKGPINNIPALVQMIAWRQPGENNMYVRPVNIFPNFLHWFSVGCDCSVMLYFNSSWAGPQLKLAVMSCAKSYCYCYDMDFHWIWIVMKIWLVKWVPGAVSVYRCCFTTIGIPIIKIRWSHGCLIFTLGILYLKLKDSFYFEMGPMWWYIYIYWLSIPLEGYKLCTSYNSSHVTVSRLSNLHISNSMLKRTVFILK